jgi:hypothetical protein
VTSFEEDRAREISLVLSFYYTDFTRYLATTISFTEKLPEEVNNQVRDAFTHLSRASVATSMEDVTRECKLAQNHIERANRDCLKASIIKARFELEELITDAVFYHGFLTPSIKTAFAQIKRERELAYIAETRSDGELISKLDEILRMTMSLADEVRQQYSVAGRRKTRILRTIKRWSRPVSWGIILLIGTILGVALRGELDKLLSAWF